MCVYTRRAVNHIFIQKSFSLPSLLDTDLWSSYIINSCTFYLCLAQASHLAGKMLVEKLTMCLHLFL